MKNILRALLIAGLVLAQMSPAFADDSDIFGRNVQPNVMILLDSSGSMDDEVPSQPYDPDTTYPIINKCGNPATSACASVKVYKLASSKYVDSKQTRQWRMAPAQPSGRDGDGIHHFWGSEVLYVPPEPGQEYRHNDALDPLWNMLDLTPEGRGDFHPKLNYA